MPKISIMQDGMSKRAYIDGKDITNVTTAIDVRIRPDEVPMATFDMLFTDGNIILNDADIRIRLHPETIQEAIALLNKELQRISDECAEWFEAMPECITKASLQKISKGDSENGTD